MGNRIDRRKFLMASAGIGLALPMLEAFAPRSARAQGAPKRLVIVHHDHGRIVGNGLSDGVDWWSPGASSKTLQVGVAASQMLAALAPINDKIVTFDGIDDIVRHASGNPDGHHTAARDHLTCKLPNGDAGGGPSLDYVAGLRLRANESQPASILIPASATPQASFYDTSVFWGDGGTQATAVSGNPQQTIEDVFGPPPAMMGTGMMPPPPTLRDRLAARRTTLLDEVRKELGDLRGKVSARDRMTLDQHAAFLEQLEKQLAGTGTGVMPGMGCTRPDETKAPHVMPQTWDEFQMTGELPDWERGRKDDLTVPFQINTLVQALACDVTRVCCLDFWGDPSFEFLFPGTSPFADSGSWHGTIHGTPRLTDSPDEVTNAGNLKKAYQFWGQMFTSLIQQLEATKDVDGSSLLDNTLVLWTSDLGYGAAHNVFNVPVVLAGLGGAFQKGRHIVEDRRTLGDLHAHLLRLLGGSDQTYGETGGASGTLGELAAAHGTSDLLVDYGFPGYVSDATKLHRGPLSL